MNEITHGGRIVDDFFETCAIAECSCGWNGPQRKTEAEAKADLAEHYSEVNRISKLRTISVPDGSKRL